MTASNRLAVTTYPDASHEDLAYDAGGNILTRRNRAGQTLAYAYDLLDRMRLKTVPWAGSLPGHAAVTAYSLAGRVTGQSDSAGPGLSYAFDTAGRATAELQLSNGVSRTVTWTLDASSNRTRLTWPDAFAVNYAYDALNRLSTATVNGGALLASYAYDPLLAPHRRDLQRRHFRHGLHLHRRRRPPHPHRRSRRHIERRHLHGYLHGRPPARVRGHVQRRPQLHHRRRAHGLCRGQHPEPVHHGRRQRLTWTSTATSPPPRPAATPTIPRTA
ncbi:MAG: RHS repeat domain-containing protein [Rhizomicrobium sp.]